MMRRRPLLRAAATAGGAYVVGKQRGRSEQQGDSGPVGGTGSAAPAASQPASGSLSPDAMDQLKSLAQLHDQGILTDQEFDEQKAKVLRT
jgi:hypothetical protein